MKKVIRERMGSAPTPVCMAWEMARCKRSGLPRKGATNVKYAARIPSEVSAPRYASPSVTDSPICVVSSTVLSSAFLGLGLADLRRYGLLFVFVNLENPHQLGELQNFSYCLIQAEQDQP